MLADQGSGCWDDEDCTQFMTEAGSGDDLITPRVLHIPRTTLSPRTVVTTPRSYVPGKQRCGDDEDCVEGSGSDRDDETTPRRPQLVTVGPWPGKPLPMPPTTARTYEYRPHTYVYPTPPPAPTTEEIDRSILFTSRPIPPSGPVYPGGSHYAPPPRPSPPPRPTGRPVIGNCKLRERSLIVC